MIMLCFPPNMAICENLIKPKVPNITGKTRASIGKKRFVRDFFFPSSYPYLLCVEAHGHIRSVVEDGFVL